jgi:transcriptional regulator with XRE-family HTH domain
VKTSPNPIDQHVGAKVRSYRLLAGVSQDRLGESLGVSFQQVQKYESGANRISASRLKQIAVALDAPVSAFFDDAMVPEKTSPSEINERNRLATEFLATVDGIRFLRAINKVRDPKAIKSIVDLVVALSSNGSDEATGRNGICSAA